MSDRPTDVSVLAWMRLVRAATVLLGKVENELKQAGFPPLAWYDVLLELDRGPEGMLPQSELQSRVLVAQYNLCRLLDRLQTHLLVERLPSLTDGRSNVVKLTEKGRQLRGEMWPTYAAAIEKHLGSRLTEDEAAMLGRLLGELVSQSERE